MNKLFKKIRLERKKTDEVVFYQGDTGRKFFIILEGEIDILEEPPDCCITIMKEGGDVEDHHHHNHSEGHDHDHSHDHHHGKKKV